MMHLPKPATTKKVKINEQSDQKKVLTPLQIKKKQPDLISNLDEVLIKSSEDQITKKEAPDLPKLKPHKGKITTQSSKKDMKDEQSKGEKKAPLDCRS